MKKIVLIALVLVFDMSCIAQEQSDKTIVKNKMKVSWYFENERIFFEMSAPTDGWVTIGFNTSNDMTGAYLIMGNVVNGKADVVEHYTISPGNYNRIDSLGGPTQIENITGEEGTTLTTLKFSLPIKAISKYQKHLTEGMEYTLIMAYSQEDDFQHHSIMRTSVKIKL